MNCGKIPRFLLCNQRIARASSATRVLPERTAFDKVFDIASRRILRASCDLCPFGTRQFSFESVEQFVHHHYLALIEWYFREAIPEAGFEQDGIQRFAAALYSPEQTGEKPFLPTGYVHIAFLRPFERVVVVLAVQSDL